MPRGWCALFVVLSVAGCDPTLATAPPHASVAPQPRPPPMQVCWVEFSIDHQPGNYALAGTSDDLDWDITYSGLLIRHPRGDLLVDVGNSTHFSDEIATAGFTSRILLRLYPGAGRVVATAPEALRRVGEPLSSLSAIAISHVHADHAGGLMDVRGVPVLLSREELAFIGTAKDAGGFDVVRAQGLEIERRAKPIQFAPAPYENFDTSFDLFGDGSIVFVPLFGHTPGSMGTFVNVTASQRFMHVGDAVNVTEAIEKRRGKSVVMDATDHDSKQANAVVAKLNQLHEQDPGLAFVPAHDRKAWARLFGAPSRCIGTPPTAPR